MILAISPEQTSPTEIEQLHKLFDAGLAYFHLRKPTATLEEHTLYIKQINDQYHDRIVTHHFHKSLCDTFNLKGIHLEEAMWRAKGDQLDEYVSAFAKAGKTISSSYHEPEDLENQKTPFDYTILSPVFSAISKSGMQGRGFDVRHINKYIIGMGGINAETIPLAIELGYQGVGALGGIWNAQDPVAAFLEMKNAFAKAN